MDTSMSATVDFVAPEMPEPLGNQELGKWGEELAARYLQAYGYVVLARNWRRRAGELDLVTACPQRRTVVAVEVKTRNAEVSVGPVEAISRAKLARLRKLTGMPRPRGDHGRKRRVVADPASAGHLVRVGTAHTMAVVGIEGRPVRIEAVLLHGLPAVTIVGLPDAAVSESRERIRAAFASAGIGFPQARLTINLSPADTPKSGTAFDLGIAVAILGAMGGREIGQRYVMGELGLDGSVRAVRGILPAALAAADEGAAMAVPLGCGKEAGLAGVRVKEVFHLAQLAEAMRIPCGPVPDAPSPPGMDEDETEAPPACPDLADVRGQAQARHALEVAAAGGHHMLVTGAPGVGKSMLAARLPGILPRLDMHEAVEVAAIASAAGEFDGRLSYTPPFSSPHHSSSAAALIGGGAIPKPGAASRAHRGVLFLDEMPEFSTHSLQTLREPMETGRIEIHRARAVVTYPARFQLIGAANPCKCGNYLDAPGKCTCSVRDRRDYFRRIGGPILDRFDINVVAPRLSRADLAEAGAGEPSAVVAERVAEARLRQRARLRSTPWTANAQVSGSWLRRNTPLSRESARELDSMLASGETSMRAVDKILRISWTLADLSGRSAPSRGDVDCAFTLRERNGFHGTH